MFNVSRSKRIMQSVFGEYRAQIAMSMRGDRIPKVERPGGGVECFRVARRSMQVQMQMHGFNKLGS